MPGRNVLKLMVEGGPRDMIVIHIPLCYSVRSYLLLDS